MEMSAIVMACFVLLLVAGIWCGFHSLATSSLKHPDAKAKVTGNCGDTMELQLVIVGNRVTKVHHCSNGCGVSKKCIEGVARLSRGKTVQELERVSIMNIMDLIGELPESHVHCAQLAETTLQYTLKSYRSGKLEEASGL